MSSLSQFFPEAAAGATAVNVGSISEFSSLDPVVVDGGKNYVSVRGVLADKNLFDPAVDFSGTFQSIYGNVTDPSVLLSKTDVTQYDFGKTKTLNNNLGGLGTSKGWYIGGVYYLYSGQNQTLTKSPDLVYWKPLNLQHCFDLQYNNGVWYALFSKNGVVVYSEYTDIYAEPTFSTILTITSITTDDQPLSFRFLNDAAFLLTTYGSLYKITPGTGALTKVLTTGLSLTGNYNAGMVYCPTGTAKYFMFCNPNGQGGAGQPSSKVYCSADGVTWTAVTMATNGDYLTNIRVINCGSGDQVIATVCNIESFASGSTHGIFKFSTAAVPVVTKYWYTSAPMNYITDIFHDGTRYVVCGNSGTATSAIQTLYLASTALLTATPTTAGAVDTLTTSEPYVAATRCMVFVINGQYFSDGTIISSSSKTQVWKKTTTIISGGFTDITLTNWFFSTSTGELTIGGVPGIALFSVINKGSYTRCIMGFAELSGTNPLLSAGYFKLVCSIQNGYFTSWGGTTMTAGNGVDKLILYRADTTVYAGGGSYLFYWNGTTMAVSGSQVASGSFQSRYALTFFCWNNNFYAFSLGGDSLNIPVNLYHSDNGGLTWTLYQTYATAGATTTQTRLLITKNAIVFVWYSISGSTYTAVLGKMRLLDGTWVTPPFLSQFSGTSAPATFSWVNLPYLAIGSNKTAIKIETNGSYIVSSLPSYLGSSEQAGDIGVGYENIGTANTYAIDFTNFADIKVVDKVYTDQYQQYSLLQSTIQTAGVHNAYATGQANMTTAPEVPSVNGNTLTMRYPSGGQVSKFDLSKAATETHRYYKQSVSDSANKFKFIRVY